MDRLEIMAPAGSFECLRAAIQGGADSVYNIPWGAKTKEAPDRKLYMVDFRHDWDVHNGRPGRLARNDDARKLRYRELGFSQILCDIEELPFL